ncbi:caspase-8 isoform 2-T4 [Anomaloglossus baeobatrachus]
MDPFTEKLFEISKQFDSGNSSELAFLCKDLSRRSCSGKKDIDIFIFLQQMGYIDENNTRLIEELLFYLNRYDLLLKHFQLKPSTMKERLKEPGMAQISPYRCLLCKLNNVIPNSKLEEIKRNITLIPKATVEKVESLLDVFNELEKKDLINEDNVDYLEEMSLYLKEEEFSKLISEYQKRNAAVVSDVRNTDEHKSPTHKKEKNELSCPFYDMNNMKRGICLIISNYDFSKARENPGQQDFNDRQGTQKDEESLSIIFSKLGFEVHRKRDLEGEKIFQTVNSYKGNNHGESDCFICCVLSHGDRGTISGTDGQSVPIRDLTFCFCSSQCPTLVGKPKLFFIQACQGKEHQQLVSLQTDACIDSEGCNSSMDLIPDEPDFLLGMATTLHCVSYRHPKHGSWYIQSLCEHLHKSYESQEDIISTLTKVNHELSQKQADNFNATQMPQPWTTLTRKLVFN